MRIALAAAAALWAAPAAFAGQTYVCQTPAFWCSFAWHESGIPDGSNCYCESNAGPVGGYSIDLAARGGSAPATAPRTGPSSGPASGGTPVATGGDPSKNVAPGGSGGRTPVVTGGGGSTGGGSTGGGSTGGGTPVALGGDPSKNRGGGAGGGSGGSTTGAGTPVGRTIPGGGGGGDPGLDTGECFRGLGNCVGQYLGN